MDTAYKYVTIFEIPEPFESQIKSIMDRAAKYTGLTPPYYKLPPHVTFHKPVKNISEETMENLVRSMSLQVRKTRMVLKELDCFGKEFMVLRVHATRAYAALWIGLHDLITKLPEYEHGAFDYENTLHITIAEKTTPVFDKAWPNVKKIAVPPMTIQTETISVYRAPALGGVWERWKLFPLSN